MNEKNIKKLKTKLLVAYFLLGVVMTSGVFIFWPQVERMAQAITGNYGKATGDTLDFGDWNNLDDDFVHRTGGATSAMQGDLDMATHRISGLEASDSNDDAVNKGEMDSAITTAIGAMPSPSIGNLSGDTLRMVCGQTGTTWVNDSAPNTVYQSIDLSSEGFTSTPTILTSIGGNNYHYKAIGGSNLYFATNNGFTVFVTHLDQAINSAIVQGWGWYLNWCAIGN